MRIFPLIGAASVVALTAAAFALPSAPASKMDTDGNGLVSKAEAMTAADAMFAKMDQNKDGALNAADRDAGVKARFQEMDADKNGSVSEAEFLAAHQDRMEDRQAKRDERKGHKGGHRGGHHGGIGGGKAIMKAADTNGDMSVTKAEFQTAAETRFAKADTDKNGSLSADEQKAARKAMRAERGKMAPPPAGA
jgi:EF hand